MLASRAENWKQQWLQEGRQEGRREGEQQGILKGETALLIRQLERKFGALPSSVQDRIAAASAADLEAWSLRILDMGSLEDVLR